MAEIQNVGSHDAGSTAVDTMLDGNSNPLTEGRKHFSERYFLVESRLVSLPRFAGPSLR